MSSTYCIYYGWLCDDAAGEPPADRRQHEPSDPRDPEEADEPRHADAATCVAGGHDAPSRDARQVACHDHGVQHDRHDTWPVDGAEAAEAADGTA